MIEENELFHRSRFHLAIFPQQQGGFGETIRLPRRVQPYHEAREWEQMETRILEAEHQVEAIRAEMHCPEVVSDGPRLQACYARLQPAEESVHALYAR
jgi:hypothetical protein